MLHFRFMIHLSELHTLMERRDKSQPHPEFSIKFVGKDGDIRHIKKAICTSSSYYRRTRTIKIIESGEIRTIRNISIIEFNNQEVIL